MVFFQIHGKFVMSVLLQYVPRIIQISKYRLISLVSLRPNIFESLVAKKIVSDLINVNVKYQRIFLRNKSIVGNLITFQYFVLDAVSPGSSVDVVYIEYAKGFDKINHYNSFKIILINRYLQFSFMLVFSFNSGPSSNCN